MRHVIGAALFVVSFAACTHPAVFRTLRPATPGDANRVLVLLTSAKYRHPVQGFVEAIEGEVREMTLEGNDDAARTALIAYQPNVVFALGGRATLLAARVLPSALVACAMVADYSSQHFQTFPNVVGIAFEAPPLQEFAQFKI